MLRFKGNRWGWIAFSEFIKMVAKPSDKVVDFPEKLKRFQESEIIIDYRGLWKACPFKPLY